MTTMITTSTQEIAEITQEQSFDDGDDVEFDDNNDDNKHARDYGDYRALTMAMMLTTTMMTTSMQQITEITREQSFDDGDDVDVDNNNARKVTQRL